MLVWFIDEDVPRRVAWFNICFVLVLLFLIFPYMELVYYHIVSVDFIAGTD